MSMEEPPQQMHVVPQPAPFSTHYELIEGTAQGDNGMTQEVTLVHATIYGVMGTMHLYANADEAADIARAWSEIAAKARGTVGLTVVPSLGAAGLNGQPK